ncbi:MAG: hypothetical protein FWF56_04095 [Firmicutes bacterium]|nr:hypothetical protein [Bacillota bacterium]
MSSYDDTTDKKSYKSGSGIHKGHRERMDERAIVDRDFEGFAPHEMLEYLLYAGVPRKDTNEIAHNLIEKFGSFFHVFYASAEELLTVKDMTRRAAHTISAVVPISRWVNRQNIKRSRYKIVNTDSIITYIKPFFENRPYEVVYMFCIDTAGYIISSTKVSQGDVDSVGLNCREIVTRANNNHASKVVIAHNHPSGILSPSFEDLVATSRVNIGLGAINVVLSDHIIFVPNGDYYSFFQNGILDDIIVGGDQILGQKHLKEENSSINVYDKVKINMEAGSDFLNELYQKIKNQMKLEDIVE